MILSHADDPFAQTQPVKHETIEFSPAPWRNGFGVVFASGHLDAEIHSFSWSIPVESMWGSIPKGLRLAKMDLHPRT
jgi:hypothetical protein